MLLINAAGIRLFDYLHLIACCHSKYVVASYRKLRNCYFQRIYSMIYSKTWLHFSSNTVSAIRLCSYLGKVSTQPTFHS